MPGNPAFVVDNMPGAGSLASANHLYRIAKADGLTLGHFSGSLFPLQAMGQKEISFDAARFEYIGAVAKVEIVCGFPKAGGIDSVEKWLAAKTPPRLGGTAPGTGGHDTTRLLAGAPMVAASNLVVSWPPVPGAAPPTGRRLRPRHFSTLSMPPALGKPQTISTFATAPIYSNRAASKLISFCPIAWSGKQRAAEVAQGQAVSFGYRSR